MAGTVGALAETGTFPHSINLKICNAEDNWLAPTSSKGYKQTFSGMRKLDQIPLLEEEHIFYDRPYISVDLSPAEAYINGEDVPNPIYESTVQQGWDVYKEMKEVDDRILRKTERAAAKYKANEHEGSGGSGED